MAEPEVRRGFGPTPEVLAYFERKGAVPAFKWLDVWGEEHSYSFMVSGAVELELTTTFKQSIERAIRNGQGFENWKAEIRKELAAIGWLGPRVVSDPSGLEPDRIVDFSSSRRLKTIFWSNMNSARAAGQWERAQRVKKALPYFLYLRTTSKEPRDEHLAFVGIILPVDDPFWATHFPPNGWGCKCQVRQVSNREAETLLATEPQPGGIRYTKEVPDLGPPIAHLNRRTGEVTMVPVGIDPGWHTNMGLSRATTLIRHAEAQLRQADVVDASAKLVELWRDPFLRAAPKLPAATPMPAGIAPHIAAEFGGAVSPLVTIGSDLVASRIRKKDDEDLEWLPDLVSRGRFIANDQSGGTILARIGRRIWRAIIRLTGAGLRMDALDELAGRELERELRKAGLRREDLDDLE